MRERRPPISTGFRSPRRPGPSGDDRSVEPPPLFPEREDKSHLRLVQSSKQAVVTPLNPKIARALLAVPPELRPNARCYLEPYPDHSGSKARLHRIRIWRRHTT